jgi:hypothetical protein
MWRCGDEAAVGGAERSCPIHSSPWDCLRMYTRCTHDEGGSASRMTDEGGEGGESNNQEGESMAEEEVGVEPGIQ